MQSIAQILLAESLEQGVSQQKLFHIERCHCARGVRVKTRTHGLEGDIERCRLRIVRRYQPGNAQSSCGAH